MDRIIILSSITYAQKAKELLEKQQIASQLTRASALRRSHGCGYGLRVDVRDLARAEAIIGNAGIRIRGSVDVE